MVALRRQQMKNHACLLLFASGTPMILGGDEFARTQQGNNNAYCQDNAISWFDWDAVSRNHDLVDFFKKAIAFVRRFPVLQRRQFALGTDLDDDGVPDLKWFGLDGGDPRWNDTEARTLCVQLDSGPDDGLAVKRLFFIHNAHFQSQWVKLPALGPSLAWHRAIDTSLPAGPDFSDAGSEIRLDPADHYIANPRSTVVLLAQ
jgi:isoamylase